MCDELDYIDHMDNFVLPSPLSAKFIGHIFTKFRKYWPKFQDHVKSPFIFYIKLLFSLSKIAFLCSDFCVGQAMSTLVTAVLLALYIIYCSENNFS